MFGFLNTLEQNNRTNLRFKPNFLSSRSASRGRTTERHDIGGNWCYKIWRLKSYFIPILSRQHHEGRSDPIRSPLAKNQRLDGREIVRVYLNSRKDEYRFSIRNGIFFSFKKRTSKEPYVIRFSLETLARSRMEEICNSEKMAPIVLDRWFYPFLLN